jgi:hypothetical protein
MLMTLHSLDHCTLALRKMLAICDSYANYLLLFIIEIVHEVH